MFGISNFVPNQNNSALYLQKVMEKINYSSMET